MNLLTVGVVKAREDISEERIPFVEVHADSWWLEAKLVLDPARV